MNLSYCVCSNGRTDTWKQMTIQENIIMIWHCLTDWIDSMIYLILLQTQVVLTCNKLLITITHLCGNKEMSIANSIVVHSELIYSINIRDLELRIELATWNSNETNSFHLQFPKKWTSFRQQPRIISGTFFA